MVVKLALPRRFHNWFHDSRSQQLHERHANEGRNERDRSSVTSVEARWDGAFYPEHAISQAGDDRGGEGGARETRRTPRSGTFYREEGDRSSSKLGNGRQSGAVAGWSGTGGDVVSLDFSSPAWKNRARRSTVSTNSGASFLDHILKTIYSGGTFFLLNK